jgi:hypothetical protein
MKTSIGKVAFNILKYITIARTVQKSSEDNAAMAREGQRTNNVLIKKD